MRFKAVSDDPLFNEYVSLVNILEIKLEKYDTDNHVEEHNQELTKKELMELHCVS